MAKVHLTESQARQLGLTKGGARKKSKGMARGTEVTVCSTCGVECAGETAEKKHNDETKHSRFEVKL